MIRVLSSLILLLLLSAGSMAAIDVYEFESEENRLRYQKFTRELRCPKCKNQNLAGTNSQIAEDLRRELYRMIREGRSDDEIVDYMVNRYGDFVLYRPRFQSNTLALWLAPLVFLVLGMVVLSVIVMHRRRVKAGEQATLSDEEQARLERLLKRRDKT